MRCRTLVLACLAGLASACDDAPSPDAARETAPAPAPAATTARAAVAVDEDPAAAPPPQETAAPVLDGEPSGPPRLVFGATSHHFGTMSEIETRTVLFRFANAGGSTLRVRDVKTTCGCTVAVPDQESYAPGEHGTLRVSLEPTAPGDDKKKMITVVTNAPGPPATLDVQADVTPFVIIEKRVTDVGRIAYRGTERVEIPIGLIDPESVIETVTPYRRDVTFSLEARPAPSADLASLGATAERTLALEIGPDTPWGLFVCPIDITVRGRPGADRPPAAHTVQIKVQGHVLGELEPIWQTSRSERYWDTFRAGPRPNEQFERSLELRHRSGRPFAITSMEIEQRGLASAEMRLEPLTPSSYRLTLAARAAPSGGEFSGTVLVRTDVPGEEAVPLKISGTIRAPAGG